MKGPIGIKMQKTTIKVTIIILILSFITILFQFSLYYLIKKTIPVLIISSFIVLLFSHILLELSFTYKTGFLYTFFIVFISIIISFLLYLKPMEMPLTYHNDIRFIILLNWLVPFTVCTLKNLFDKGPRIVGFYLFFIRSSILFGLLYSSFLLYKLLIDPIILIDSISLVKNYNIVSFLTVASYIEPYIYDKTNFIPLLLYVFKYALLFLPLGFYIALLTHRLSYYIKKIGIILMIPFITELFQCMLKKDSFYIDNFIFSLLGILIGETLYFILNGLHNIIRNRDFLSKENPNSFHMRTLY
jgi:hypothetical protein